jgi:hypothetical protein
MANLTPPKTSTSRGMPPQAIQAIAASGFLCALVAAFMAYYAWRNTYPLGFVYLNALTSLFLIVGSAWMLRQVAKAA